MPRAPRSRAPGASLLSLLVAIAGCTNEPDNLAASKLGDVSHPARRGSPIADIVAACGSGNATTYVQDVTTHSATIGWRAPDGTQRWTTFRDLQPDTIYCYSVGDSRTGFRTAPLAGDPDPVRFLVFGDSGGDTADQRALARQMYDFPFALILHTGDVAYDGTHERYQQTVFDVYGGLLQSVPLFPAAGNHDHDGGDAFRSVFALPARDGQTWYSFDWGRVHFVALDTEADYAEQARWLDQDLAATTRPWKIVYLHRPPYSSGAHGSNVRLRETFAPVFEKHGVQLVFAGHDHDYERTWPQHGTYYVVTGGGGIGTRDVGRSSFTAFSDAVIHFVYVEVGEHELVLHAIDATGEEFDSLVIPR